MFTLEARQIMLRALLDAVVEAGWGTSGAATATALDQPRLHHPHLQAPGGGRDRPGVRPGLERGGDAHPAGDRALWSARNGNRVMLYRRVRDPVVLEVGMTVIDRLTVRLEEV